MGLESIDVKEPAISENIMSVIKTSIIKMPIQNFTSVELILLLKDKLTPIFMNDGVDFAILGGSWARNQQAWWSDVDIFISYPPLVMLDPRLQLKNLLQMHVQATLRTQIEEVNISILEKLPLHVQFSALSDGILLYERDPNLKPHYVEKMLRAYYDHQLWYERLVREALPTF